MLKERKQIIIQDAVTGKCLNWDLEDNEINGLNKPIKSDQSKGRPMKDSGVEWIGEIPADWEVRTKMKFISILKGWQGLKAEEYTNEGPHLLSSAHFNNYIIDWNKCPRVSMERYLMDVNIQIAIGDILLMKDGANMG
ncbi:hypothetical protein DMA11_23715 [Marinilabiliaceae bacterium JC017]|nr:hypothetical protein DMA11_23715 [Marinilabiliaceae bacterium JC017]